MCLLGLLHLKRSWPLLCFPERKYLMREESVKRGDLLFLTHPGTDSVFSGYGLVVESGSTERLVGLLLVDRPRPVSTA